VRADDPLTPKDQDERSDCEAEISCHALWPDNGNNGERGKATPGRRMRDGRYLAGARVGRSGYRPPQLLPHDRSRDSQICLTCKLIEKARSGAL